MEDFADRYGSRFVKLVVDSRATGRSLNSIRYCSTPDSRRLIALGGAGPGRDQAQDNEIFIQEMVEGRKNNNLLFLPWP